VQQQKEVDKLFDTPNLTPVKAAQPDRDRETPLHLVSRLGQVDVVHMLIDHGADMTAKNKNYDGWTPLDLALQRGRVGVACVLIERRADLTARD
jgi:ankyrin repeat protein